MPPWIMLLIIAGVIALGIHMTRPAPPHAWACMPQPGHCDIDEDWYQKSSRSPRKRYD